jgi:hypothetical protein
MMNANAMRENANNFHENARKAELEKVKNFCEGDVATAIETEANKGGYSVIVSIPSGVSTLLTMDYLENNGYEVERKSGHLLVKW